MKLPALKNCIITHYGCSDFREEEHRIFYIGAIYNITVEGKKYFFEHNKSEVEMIEKYGTFIKENRSKTFLHWTMNSPIFGFTAMQERYRFLTGEKIDLLPSREIDLSEFLKGKYGIDYVERESGRLNNLALLNKFRGLNGQIEKKKLKDATDRLELIFSIAQAEIQGKLKTNSPLPKQKTIAQKNPQEEVVLEYTGIPEAQEKTIKIKPIFKSVDSIFQHLKDFFSQEDRTNLKLILLSGDDSPRVLTFLDNGNRLADYFKRLYEDDIITGCHKKELESWIVRNFRFRNNDKIKEFKPKYINNIISSNQLSCKKPIEDDTIDIDKGKFRRNRDF